ncbi:hypothetical protein [Priestia megaterium]|uniref:Uncharacterized protein n=1 Tax=Priestia megaterium TaxID=1404 RepID=A0A6M6E487_PRIMG|nr:hypothetical protein [Priestia megaterium]QJX80476.1 hypothetical protein FDZ14_30780 [Priestia megaterium]
MMINSVKEMAEQFASSFILSELKEAALNLYKAPDRSFVKIGTNLQTIKVKEFMKVSMETGESSEIKRAMEYKLLTSANQFKDTEATQRVAERLVDEFELCLERFLNNEIDLVGKFFIDYEHNASTKELTCSICYEDIVAKNMIMICMS